MTKKITLVMLVLLIVSAFVFVSCEQAGEAPGQKSNLLPVVNVKGTESNNLVFGGDMEKSSTDCEGDGAKAELVAGEGVDGSKALFVDSNKHYGEVMVDLTEYYGRGKSYYVEASFRNAGIEGARTDDLNAKIDFNAVSGAGFKATGRTYDIPGQYDGGWMDPEAALEVFGYEIEGDGAEGAEMSDDEWVTVAGILDAETIDNLLVNQTKLNGGGDVTLYELTVVFYVGTYQDEDAGEGPGQRGYKYYLDNVVIKDLNKELKRTGATYKVGGSEDPGDDGGDDDELEDEDDV